MEEEYKHNENKQRKGMNKRNRDVMESPAGGDRA
jgi:hypothetical protein